MTAEYQKLLHDIQPVEQSHIDKAFQHLDQLTKPPRSLGKLEEIAARYCAIHKTEKPKLRKKRIFTFAADHGVTEEGVSAFPSSVTPQMVHNFLQGGAAVNVLAKTVNARVVVVDIGVDEEFGDIPNLVHAKVRRGSRNFLQEYAMTQEECLEALRIGYQLAKEAEEDGVELLGTGDMGIGNTTPSTALYSALLDIQPEEITGRGTGIDDATLARKTEVIKEALTKHKKSFHDPFLTLCAVGGFEIAGICGLLIGASRFSIPVIVDGFISGAAAAVAVNMDKHIGDYLFFSHLSAEQGHKKVLEKLQVSPLLQLDMRLGEGSGSAVAMGLFDAAVNIYNNMASFASAGVDGKIE